MVNIAHKIFYSMLQNIFYLFRKILKEIFFNLNIGRNKNSFFIHLLVFLYITGPFLQHEYYDSVDLIFY